MDKPRPKFCVGEQILICGEMRTEYNGQVHEILKIKWMERARDSISKELFPRGYRYLTTTHPIVWRETALRKLPPEDRISFNDCEWQPDKEGAEA